MSFVPAPSFSLFFNDFDRLSRVNCFGLFLDCSFSVAPDTKEASDRKGGDWSSLGIEGSTEEWSVIEEEQRSQHSGADLTGQEPIARDTGV